MSNDAARNWSLERDAEGVAWLTLDKPGTSANVLSSGVLVELDLDDALARVAHARGPSGAASPAAPPSAS